MYKRLDESKSCDINTPKHMPVNVNLLIITYRVGIVIKKAIPRLCNIPVRLSLEARNKNAGCFIDTRMNKEIEIRSKLKELRDILFEERTPISIGPVKNMAMDIKNPDAICKTNTLEEKKLFMLLISSRLDKFLYRFVRGSFKISKYLVTFSATAQTGTTAFAVTDRIKIGEMKLRQLTNAIDEDFRRIRYCEPSFFRKLWNPELVAVCLKMKRNVNV